MPTNNQILSFIKDNRPTGMQLANWGLSCSLPLPYLAIVVKGFLIEGMIKEYTIGEGEEIEVGYEGV